MRGSFPLDHKPYYSRRIDDQRGDGPQFDRYGQVLVEGSVILPVPTAPVNARVAVSRPLSWSTEPDPTSPSFDTLGGFGLVVCKPEEFHYQLLVDAFIWDREEVREHQEHRIRAGLLKALEERFPITMNVKAA